MGRAGVCWDNAMAESFWATLKTEYYYRRTFTTRDQVYTGVATWIETSTTAAASTPASAANPPSNTNYTKRPGQKPHKQTVNNLRTGPHGTPPKRGTPNQMSDTHLGQIRIHLRHNRRTILDTKHPTTTHNQPPNSHTATGKLLTPYDTAHPMKLPSLHLPCEAVLAVVMYQTSECRLADCNLNNGVRRTLDT